MPTTRAGIRRSQGKRLSSFATNGARGFVRKASSALMKPTAYIVNTARGEVIDENALARMIENDEL
ncbi:MAG: NAD(P)-dependent oxidoreductase, partial [Methyloceanibacter sp.]